MAETSGFFDAEELVGGGYDREYVAEQWANYFKLFISNGVFVTPTNQLKVVANSGMTIKVRAGWAWINGYWYNNGADLTMTVPANTSASTKKHGIFVQYDSGNRTIKLVVGSERTTVNRTPPYYELKLAEITVAPGTSAITDAMITDTRSNSSVCGFVTGVVNVIDSTELFAQFTAIFNNFLASAQAYETEHQEEFEDWFEHMKDQLSTDAAGHLQLEIDNLSNYVYDTGCFNKLRNAQYSQKYHNVDFTVNDDKTVLVNSDGTNSGTAIFRLNAQHPLPVGVAYHMSGCPSGGSSADGGYCLQARFEDSNGQLVQEVLEYGNGVDLPANVTGASKLIIAIAICGAHNTTTGKLFKPMVTSIDVPNSDYNHYVPYAATNYQLTTDKVDNSTLGEVGAVNLAPNDLNPFTLGSLSVAVNADKSITINGSTPDTLGIQFAYVEHLLGKTVKLYNPEGDNDNIYLDLSYEYNGSVVTKTPTDGAFTIPSDAGEPALSLMIQGGVTYNAFKFYPMVTPPEYNGHYVPYAMTNQQLTADKVGIDSFSEVGAVNQLSLDLATIKSLNTGGSWSGNAYTHRGITYTVNANYTITANGTASADSVLILNVTQTLTRGITYKLTGTPSLSANNIAGIQKTRGGSANDTGSGATFTADSDAIYMYLYVYSGKTVDNITFQPMISLASMNLSYNDYVPYAKSNRELTEDEGPEEIPFVKNQSSVSTVNNFHILRVGKNLIFRGYLQTTAAMERTDVLLTLNTEYKIKATTDQNDNFYFTLINGGGTTYSARINGSKELKIDSTVTVPAGYYAIVGSAVIE